MAGVRPTTETQQQVANRLAHQRGLSPNPLTDRPIGRGQSTGEGSRASEEESGESTGFDDDDDDDDESEDDEEEESEEDRAFIYDDELEEDLTFYRRVDLERGLEPLPLTAKRRDPTPPAAPHKSGWTKGWWLVACTERSSGAPIPASTLSPTSCPRPVAPPHTCPIHPH